MPRPLRQTVQPVAFAVAFVILAAGPAWAQGSASRGGADPSAPVRLAQRALDVGPFSVMQKARVPPSGDKHDFLTLAPYWWPDPSKRDGLPYIRRDGEVNPESKRGTDDEGFGAMAEAVSALADGYRAAGDERFAARGALLLRTWFLDPATRMTPHLTFGQAVPGRNQGRGAGIISTRKLVAIVEAARGLARSPAWTEADREGLRAWCTEYARWLRTSPNGRDEAAARNNHGTWYDAQLVALLLYTARRVEARGILESVTRRRLDAQIEPDGRQPQELARTRSWSYSVMNLDGWFTVARLASDAGVDLWHERAPRGGSIRAALDYLVPFARGGAPWPHQQITAFEPRDLVSLLRRAATAWKAPEYADLADRLESRQ